MFVSLDELLATFAMGAVWPMHGYFVMPHPYNGKHVALLVPGSTERH
jgi:hypothetical protein